MALTPEEKKAIIAYRIQKSFQTMVEAEDNANMGHWSLAANRMYYAMFHMATVVLIDKGLISKTHSGIICLIGQKMMLPHCLSRQSVCWRKCVV